MNKQSEKSNIAFHKRLAIKITAQFIGIVIVFEIGYILLNLLFLIIMGATNLDQTIVFQAFKPFMIPTMIVVSIVGCGYISYRFMLRPLEHLYEIAEAAQKLAHPTDAPIILSHNLKYIEYHLNQVREQTLENIKHAQISEQHKNDILIYLAHDLKTPLTSVLGYLKLIEDEPEISSELIYKYTNIARKKAQRLEELLNEFFEIAWFRTEKLSLELATIHLSRMLMQITYEFHPMLAEKELEWDLQISENVQLICDADKLERAIDNLIRNAINYSYPKTKILFSMIQINDGVQICIKNKGQTISPEKIKRIFEQFYRLDTARSSDTGGAGLGLAIAKEIIELHHGTITAFSEYETIEFMIYIPYDSQKIVRNLS